MRQSLLTLLAVCLVTAHQAAAQVPRDPVADRQPAPPGKAEGAAELPAPFVTRQAEIEIPFSVRAGTTRENQPASVRIFVSWDRGKTWHFYDERKPEEGRFRFRPRHDGEFWFATQTIDRSGRPDNADPRAPQLRVLIDTERPQLTLQANVDASGNIAVSWNAVDANLAPKSLKVEYQDAQGNGGPWHAVTLPAGSTKLNAQHSGQATFHPTATGRTIVLRAEVADAAGNMAYFSQRLALTPSRPKPEGNLAYSPAPDPSATRWPTDNPHVGIPSGGQLLPGSQLAASAAAAAAQESEKIPNLMNNPFVGPGRLASASSNQPAEALPPPAARPLNENSDVGPIPASERPSAAPRSTWSPSNSQYPAPGTESALPIEPLPGQTTSPAVPSPPVNSFPPADSGRQSLPSGPNLDFSTPGPASGLPEIMPPPQPAEPVEPPTAQRPRLTNSRRFSLEYDLQTVGPEGVSAVELWGTTDGGRTWVKWGADPDRISPFDVEVNSESLYGFRIVVVGKNGLATHTPQHGEPADIWVGVDLSRPKARLTGAAYGQGEAAGKLDIRWEASDDNLGSRPITLAVGERPEGPFTPLAAGLPNSGQYFWEFDPRSPRQLYLRLEVRDDAGNVAIEQLTEPIKVEGLEPKGRIRGFTSGPGDR